MKHIKHIIIGVLIILCIGYLFSRCSIFTPTDNENPVKQGSGQNAAISEYGKAAEELLAKMTIEEKIYQMFFVTPEQLTGVGEVIQAGETTKNALNERAVGGIIYSEINLQTIEQTKELLKNTREYSKIPVFAAVYEDGGADFAISGNPDMEMEKTDSFGTIGKSQDYNKAFEAGRIIGSKLSELGFNVDFAPTADISDKESSFGKDPQTASKMVSEFIKGLGENNISATLKHFPSQGMAKGDTQYDYLVSDRSESEIRKNELVPFEGGIASGADFVMVGLVKAKALDSENPAVFSKKIVTNLLREEMGFNGIIITDEMNKGAVLNSYTSKEATIKAINSGVDMILMPNDLEIAYKAVYDAVKSGEISESRIDESVKRILTVKLKKGMI